MIPNDRKPEELTAERSGTEQDVIELSDAELEWVVGGMARVAARTAGAGAYTAARGTAGTARVARFAVFGRPRW